MRALAEAASAPSDIDLTDPKWAAAQARLRLYLQALRLPASEVEALTAAALRQAHAARPAEPLAAAMEALHALLAAREPVVANAVPSMPEMRRGAMVPEPLNRSPLHFFSRELLWPMVVGTMRLLTGTVRRQRLLVIMIAIGGGVLFQTLH